jgi:mono/diheme cytochrome c family protein
MVKGFLLCLFLMIVLAVIGGFLILHYMPINSLQPAGAIEERIAIRGRNYLLSRDAENQLPTQPAATPDAVEDGHTSYGSLCAGCHGYDGHTPTPLGSSMFPHAPSLAAPGPQRMSDAEMFVAIRGGIRHSGMPGFGKSESSEQIWHLVQYIRTLPNTPVRAK